MKLESLYIKNFRGIKDLRLDLLGKNFVIDGPNGSGKSGVVDAIEFVFTGQISRLEGPGTGGLSVRTHGPHVDKRDNPRDSLVTATVRLGDGRVVTIERNVDKPKEPKIVPDEAVEQVRWLSEHPELALSRRELIKFILVEPGERSKAIQALLKLDRLEEVRRNLTKAANTLDRESKSAGQELNSARVELSTAAGTASASAEQILREANQRRSVLGLAALTEFTSATRLSSGLTGGAVEGSVAKPQLSKTVATRDWEAVRNFIDQHIRANVHVQAVLGELVRLDAQPGLFALLERRELFRSGLDLVVDGACPLCDTAWNTEALQRHLKAKLSHVAEAEAFAGRLVAKSAHVAGDAQLLADQLGALAQHAAALGEQVAADRMRRWKEDLQLFRGSIRTSKGVIASRERLERDWANSPESCSETLQSVRAKIDALHAPSDADAARTYLVICDERLDRYRKARSKDEGLKKRAEVAARARDVFNKTVDGRLSRLYQTVEQDLVRFYRFINADDENTFQAKLDPAQGRLTLEVDFYDRGLFPPSAYHSEGHQDGMGLCLYFALTKQLLGSLFTFSVLDDVLMSVDSGHRKRVCSLLREEFPETQFVLTTHDEVWCQQLISAKLVDKGSVKRFRGWTVEHGPLVDEYKEVWEAINEHLARDDVSQGAALLRRHLEQVAGDLCERLRASAPYRRDADHDLGELLPAATGKWSTLLKEAKNVAASWGQDGEVITKRETMFKGKRDATQLEQWAVNRSVHYNEWANMSKNDFHPVVSAYRELLACFRCEKCDGWLTVSPVKGTAEAIICDCKAVCINLKKKAKI